MPTVTCVDETVSGPRTVGRTLDLVERRVRLDELIRRRIRQEVAAHNADPDRQFRVLAGGRAPRGRVLDWREQYARALEAFGRNGFLVLVGDRQVTKLDHEITLAADTEVTFLALVPLVGG